MKELVFLLEEESARALLEQIIPRIVPPPGEVASRYIVFEGKQDLLKQLERRLRGYLNPHARFIVLQDQDSGDCRKIKKKLRAICKKAGKPDAVIRIACRELEAFYLGDLRAVEMGLKLDGLASRQKRQKFRNPDELVAPSRELERLTSRLYQKVSGSRAIGPHLNLDAPRSRSFQHLVGAIRDACSAFELI